MLDKIFYYIRIYHILVPDRVRGTVDESSFMTEYDAKNHPDLILLS